MNPYLDESFFEERDKDREATNMTGKYKKVWARQNERCNYCGKPILVDERKLIVPINPELPQTAKNCAYVHANCSYGQVEFINNDFDFISKFDLYRFLEQMLAGKPAEVQKTSKYYPLAVYFQKQTKEVINLQLNEVEEILGKKLCKSAYKGSSFWCHDFVSNCWNQNGYRLHSFKGHILSFVRVEDHQKGEMIDLPQFLYKRLPKNACTEIKAFLEYIKRRYGL
jgi:RNA-directed DNA polymerase